MAVDPANPKTASTFQIHDSEVEVALRKIANIIKPLVPRGHGFNLLIFPYGEPVAGSGVFYISTAERADVINVMKEFIANNER